MKRNAIGQQENIILYVNILYILRFSRELHKENVQDFCIVILFSKLFIFKQKFLIILMLASPCTIKQFVQLFINALIVWIVSECTDVNDINTVSAQQAKDI